MAAKAPLGSPDWLRAVPRRWGLGQSAACRVMGIAPSTFRAKCAGRRQITERLIGRIVDVEMLLIRGDVPFGWPFDQPLPNRQTVDLSPRTLDHYRNILAGFGEEIAEDATG